MRTETLTPCIRCLEFTYFEIGCINIQLFRTGEMAYLQAPLLAESGLAEHAFSTRLGGCSSGMFTSLNTAYHTGDDPENVIENRQRLFGLFNYDHLEIVSSLQVHGDGMALFNQSHSGEGALPDSARQKCDALITTEAGLPLTAYSADCMLIYFISQQKPLVGLAHAGWRGTLEGISNKVVSHLDLLFGIAPGRLLVGLSPVICKNCYLVDREVAERFKFAGWGDNAYLEQVDEEIWKLDLAAINTEQLLRAGVNEENLARNEWCTACNPDLFYSYRRDQGKTGRMLGFVALKTGRRN